RAGLEGVASRRATDRVDTGELDTRLPVYVDVGAEHRAVVDVIKNDDRGAVADVEAASRVAVHGGARARHLHAGPDVGTSGDADATLVGGADQHAGRTARVALPRDVATARAEGREERTSRGDVVGTVREVHRDIETVQVERVQHDRCVVNTFNLNGFNITVNL